MFWKPRFLASQPGSNLSSETGEPARPFGPVNEKCSLLFALTAPACALLLPLQCFPHASNRPRNVPMGHRRPCARDTARHCQQWFQFLDGPLASNLASKLQQSNIKLAEANARPRLADCDGLQHHRAVAAVRELRHVRDLPIFRATPGSRASTAQIKVSEESVGNQHRPSLRLPR